MKNILILILIGVGGWFTYNKLTLVDEFSNGEYKNSKHNLKIIIPPSWIETGSSSATGVKYATSQNVDNKVIASPLSKNDVLLSISTAKFSSPDVKRLTLKEWKLIKRNISASGITITFNNVETYNGIKIFIISGIKGGKYYEYAMFDRNEQLFQILFIMKENLVERFKKDKFKILKGIKNYN